MSPVLLVVAALMVLRLAGELVLSALNRAEVRRHATDAPPAVAAAPDAMPPARVAPPPVGPTPAPAPGGAGGAGGPTGGDVFLDGMRVGRWLARELARQADAPQSGATMFDPRASGSWPGSLQGEAVR